MKSLARVAAGDSPAKSRGSSFQVAFLSILGLTLLVTTACGYHTAGHAVTLPANVQTIAIPAFVNRTQTYKIEQRLTAAVVQEMITRTHYHVLNEADDSADATLRGYRDQHFNFAFDLRLADWTGIERPCGRDRESDAHR